MQQKTLEEHAKELRRVCQHLVPYSFPKHDIREEEDLIPLKCRQIIVDGYDVSVNMSFSDFEKYQIENVQIQGVYTPFLPLYVVCKVAKAFLGERNLSCTDFVKNNRKIYNWMVRRRGNKTLKPSSKYMSGEFEGFSYTILKPGHLNLYETTD